MQDEAALIMLAVIVFIGFVVPHLGAWGAARFRRAGENFARRRKRERILRLLDQVQSGDVRGLAKVIVACDGDTGHIGWVTRKATERGLLAKNASE